MISCSLRKMHASTDDEGRVSYSLKNGNVEYALNPLLGQKIRLHFEGSVHCISCNRKVKKTFQQGYCFPCARSLPETDLCQVRPELCHFTRGTCRNSSWGKEHCFIPHTVYLALSSDIKVGITRTRARVNRWIDQGATMAVPVAGVRSRFDAGRAEVALKKIFTDKTNWRSMLKGEVAGYDLAKERLKALGQLPEDLEITPDPLKKPVCFQYPVLEAPRVIRSLNPEKSPHLEGTLLGIKGQYMILDSGVLNVRKYAGHQVSLTLH